jgi:ADP-ribose pyrophosphatase
MGRTLMSGAVFSVERREYRHADGRVISRDVVVHPGAVTILPILDEERMVLIQNYRLPVGRELFELPAGTLDPQESPEQCARRELEEETGYRAGRIEPLCEFFTTPGICTERMWVFVAGDLTETQQQLQGNEQIRVAVTDISRVRQMLKDGAIEDGKTIAALGTYFLRQDRDAR